MSTNAPTPGQSMPSTQDTVTNAVLQAERARSAAMIASNLSALDELLDVRLAFCHSNGQLDDKAAYLAKMAAGRIHYLSIDWREERVMALGEDAAILTGCMKSRVEVEGVEKVLDNRVTAAWARLGTTWRMIAFQSTPILR